MRRRNLLKLSAAATLANGFTAGLSHEILPASSDQKIRSRSLFGRMMCGYQGWFSTPDDGSRLGWRHYGFERPEACHIDLWPEVSEFEADELSDTPLKFADGSTARVFSSVHPKTVRRHFEWMKTYGIDGVFLQRFGTEIKDPLSRARADAVLEQVRRSAEATDRTFCMMYDLTGLRAGEIDSVVMQDWKRLRTELRVLESPAYQHHTGRPLVAVWGIGFNDARAYSLDECSELLRFLHDNPEFGLLTVMAGVPWGWRTLSIDATADAKLHDVLKSADIVSPWSVGRYGDDRTASRMIAEAHEPDTAWCRERGMEYMPVIFPGFSWSNLTRMRGGSAPLNQIARREGKFLWYQACERISRGANMLYVAMFDELDEGTAIMKTAARVPEGPHRFVTEPSLPADHYLRLTGRIGEALRKEIPLTVELPKL